MCSQPLHDVGSHLVAVGLVENFVARTGVQHDLHIGNAGIAITLPQNQPAPGVIVRQCQASRLAASASGRAQLADNQKIVMVKILLALLLASACFQAQPTNLSPCDKAVRFTAAWFADPEVDNAKSAAELTKIGAGAGRSGTQLGHVVVETKLAVMPQTSCQGVVVRLDYIKPVLRVASEIPLGSCAYAHVMRHEQTHVRIHRDIARQFRELDYPWASGASSAGILVYAKQELDRLMQAQVLFDNPEEYASNFSACGGEIERLVKPAASTKSAHTPG